MKMKLDSFQAMLLAQREEAIEGYRQFLKCNGSLMEYIRLSKPELRHRYISVDPPSYQDLIEDVSFHIGIQMGEMNKVASAMKTWMTLAEREYIDCWRLCASMIPTHPELPKREKYCKDYQANEALGDHTVYATIYYDVGTPIICNLFEEASLTGKVIELLDNWTMKISLDPIDKRRKKIIKIVDRNSLHVFPSEARILPKGLDKNDNV